MTGYQEILTDPSYCRQIVTLTYPHIGNTGANPEDYESSGVFAAGLIIRDLPLLHSNYRAEESLHDFLVREGVVAIADIDTRRLTRIIREKGAQAGCSLPASSTTAAVVEQARAFPGPEGHGSGPGGQHRGVLRMARLDLASSLRRDTSRGRVRRTMWWPTISASSAISCVCSLIMAAR